ncbi:MAG: C25 family cysteine peptidase, partial [Candidatus Tenebribacter burtonii]|nr:C25 family cysteine peptidase [Candidatus Tenebribacter burtonii]
MKKIVLFVLLFSLFSVANLLGYTNMNYSTASALNVGIDIPEVKLTEREFRDGNTYSSIIFPNAGKLMVGKPDVPGLANWILIPNGTNVSISTYPGTPLIFENVDLAPVQEEPFDNVDSPLPPFAKDQVVYSTDKNYPGLFAEVESTKRKRGQECTILWIYPYQYNPVERTLTVYPDLEVSVNFNGVIKPIPSNLKNDKLLESLKGFAINAEEVLQAEESAETTKPARLERTDGCELLIITDPSFSSAANTLADWKTKRGIFTTVVTTTTTGSSVSQIENYIDNAYDNWTPAPSYFLFIGDDEDIPAQDVTFIPSDFYYADRDDPVDWVADLGYGRLSVDTSSQADSLVARIIRYERSPSTNSNYYDDILTAACFQDGEFWNLGASTEAPDGIANRRFCKTSEDVRNYLHDEQGYPWSQREYVAYNRVPVSHPGEIFPEYWSDNTQHSSFIFENDDPPDGGVEIPASMQKPTFPWDGNTTDISSAFNNGVFFALFRAHGYSGGWYDPDFFNGSVDALTNGEDRPIIWSITCQSGRFDDTECFAEYWIRHTTGGSCGILAATRNSYSGPNDRLIWGMMNAIWPNFDTYCSFSYGGSTPMYRMGDVKNYGMNYMSTHYPGSSREDTINLFHWFGDPTMEMWTSQPNQLTKASSTTNVVIGTSSMNLYVEPAVSGMLVCAYNENDDVFATATTNASGYAYLTFNNPLTSEAMVNVTVTKHNYLPYEFIAGTNVWDGSYNHYWSQFRNWSLGHVPTAGENVIIPDVGYCHPMTIDYDDAECLNLTIEAGVELEIEVQSLTVHNDLDVYGDLTLNDTASRCYVNHDIRWQSGSTGSMTGSATIDVKEDWNFNNGANVQFTAGYVEFSGSATSWLRSYEENCEIFRLRSNKGSANLNVSDASTEDLHITGNIYNYSGSTFQINSAHSVIIDGFFNNMAGHIYCSDGTLIFNGNPSTVSLKPNVGDYFNNLTINTSSTIALDNTYSSVLTINGNMDIQGGALNANAFTIEVAGHWTNNVGPSGFVEGTGRVTFNGPGPDMQYIYGDETFNIIENNTVQAIRINNYVVTCNSYDWTSGNISVSLGTFIANDLFDNGVYGSYYALTGSEIYLYQDAGQFIDLFSSNVSIYGGGLIKITGGADESYWCTSGSLDLEINTGGILDFDGPGITIFDSSLLTENITDGSIKTSGWFTCYRTDFNPTGGTIELYGSTDASMSMGEFSNFYNVLINKTATDNLVTKSMKSSKHEKVRIDRDGAPVELTRSSTVNVTSDLDINGDFILDTGVFDSNGYDMLVAGDWTNNVGNAGFIEGSQTVTFAGPSEGDILTEETFYNMTVDKTIGSFTALEMFENIHVTNDIHIVDGVLEMNPSSNLIVGNNVTLESGAGLNANDAADLLIYVGGNWTNYNIDYDIYHGFWHGYICKVIFNSGGDNILTTSAPQEDFYNLTIYKSSDQFRSNDNIQVFGNLLLVDGEWNDNISGLTHTFHGDFEVTSNAA